MKLRIYHTEDLNADRSQWREVFPLGPKTYQWKVEKKEVFFRQKQKGGFLFINNPTEGIDDFDFFIQKENDPIERCKTRYLITELFCDGEYTQFHVGKFTLNDCDFDLDKCTIDAKQSIVDVYSCLKENKKEKYNILSSAPIIKTISPIQNNFEFLACRNKGWLDPLFKPCDATGGWKKFYTKAAINTPQPRSTIYTDNTADDYYNAMQTKDHAAWIKQDGLIYTLEIYRYADNALISLAAGPLTRAVYDKGMFAFTVGINRTIKAFRPDLNQLTNVVVNHPFEILWFDVDDTLGNDGYAFYYDTNNDLYAYNFDTGLTRLIDNVDIQIELQTLVNVRQISYGDGLLAYHDNVSNELRRYNPLTLLVDVVDTIQNLKFLESEDGYLTWFDINAQHYNLQNRDDTTFEIILIRDVAADCRYSARSNEWLCFDDGTAGAQLACNLINPALVFFLNVNTGGGPFIPSNLVYKIENGWWLFTGQSLQPRAVYLDSNQPTAPVQYWQLILSVPLQNSIISSPNFTMNAGVERIYTSGQSSVGGFPQDFEIWSTDMKDNSNTMVENLGPETTPTNEIGQILMNGYGQVLTVNQNRVHVYKENIQRDDELTVWFRENIITVCSGGNPNPPAGSWILYKNQCKQFGFSTYVRQPTMAAPPPSEVFEGNCLCEDLEPNLVLDEDECVSINPNSTVVNFPLNPTTSLNAGTIIGPIDGKQPLGAGPQNITFYIEKPRDGSTYTWTPPPIGVTILSGQGTDVCVMQFTSAFPSNQVTCQEVNPCEAAPIPLIVHPFVYRPWNYFGSSLTTTIPIYVEVDTYSGATINFIRAFNNPWAAGGSNVVTGESISAFSVDSKNRTVLNVVHDGVSGSVGWSGTQGGASFSGSCAIVAVPTSLPIDVPAEVCPTGLQTYKVENPRPGCVYTWKVDSPAFIVGPIIGESVVIDNNGLVAGTLRVDEVCPIQPTTYQLIAPCDELHSDSWWWEIGPDLEYGNTRLLKNVIEDLVKSICPDLEIRSEFFQWNSLNPSPINYVTGTVNDYRYLTIAQKSDIRNPTATEPATIGHLTWADFVKWCQQLFEVYWYIEDGIIYFEHISIIQGPLGIDTTQEPYAEFTDNTNQYKYDKFDMARRQVYESSEQENADFVGFPIEYKDSNDEWSECVNEEEETENTKELTVDLKYIQTNPFAIENKGFVIMACTFDGVDYKVIQKPGVITGLNIINQPMAWSTLQENFMQHNRTLSFGWMNRSFRFFQSSKFFKKQDKFKIPLCCDVNFNPLDLVKTKLGTGKVEEAEIDYRDDMLELKLKYE